MVGNDIWVFDTGEDSDLVNGVKTIFLLHFSDLNFLLSVNPSILLPLDQKYLTV